MHDNWGRCHKKDQFYSSFHKFLEGAMTLMKGGDKSCEYVLYLGVISYIILKGSKTRHPGDTITALTQIQYKPTEYNIIW